jgi:hypothetical protein
MSHSLHDEVSVLLTFLARRPLTTAVSDLEHALDGADRDSVTEVARGFGIDAELVRAAVLTRRELGRINDLIHASAIVTLLPSLLEPGEVVVGRPSLAAGNDPSRRYDLETNLRVAEFKFAEWKGSDAMRMRGVFKDLVHLAAHDDDRRPELYVIGDRPLKFMMNSTSPASWALDRAKHTRPMFEEKFGPLTMTVAQFTRGPGSRVKLIRLEDMLPALAQLEA